MHLPQTASKIHERSVSPAQHSQLIELRLAQCKDTFKRRFKTILI